MTEKTNADTLFIVHVERMFYRSHFDDNLLEDIVHQAIYGGYRRVISLTSCIMDMHPMPEVERQCTEDIEWGWGYEPEMFECQEEELPWVIEALGHEYTWVPPELRDGRDFGFCHVVGGCRSECLQDWLDVLDHVGIEYDVLEELTY